MHSGMGGLAHALEEIRLTRPSGPPSSGCLTRSARRWSAAFPTRRGTTTSTGSRAPSGSSPPWTLRVSRGVARLLELATPDGWPASWLGPPQTSPDGRCNDVTLGTAACCSVLFGPGGRRGWRGACRARRRHPFAEQEDRGTAPTGRSSRCVSCSPAKTCRCRTGRTAKRYRRRHGRRRDDARAGRPGRAGHLGRGVPAEHGRHQRRRPPASSPDPGIPDLDTFTYSWCHGPTGTSLLFAALDRAGVSAVGGATPGELELACLHSLRVSGIPRTHLSRVLGQRRSLLRHGRCRRLRPQRLAASRPRGGPRLRDHAG